MGSVAHVTRETIYIYDTYYKQHSSFEYIHVYTWHSLYLHLSSTLLNQQDDVEQPLPQSKSGDVIIPNKSKSSSNPGSKWSIKNGQLTGSCLCCWLSSSCVLEQALFDAAWKCRRSLQYHFRPTTASSIHFNQTAMHILLLPRTALIFILAQFLTTSNSQRDDPVALLFMFDCCVVCPIKSEKNTADKICWVLGRDPAVLHQSRPIGWINPKVGMGGSASPCMKDQFCKDMIACRGDRFR